MLPLLGYFRRNEYSQHGEDGILAEILNRLKITQGYCVEFGAWDGKYLSNTFALVLRGWNAILIEGDVEKYKDLLATARAHSNIFPINAYVAAMHEEPTSLDNLLKLTPCPSDFEVLSIDIDSYDLLVWESLKNYKPKVVIIETNDQHGPEAYFRYAPTPVGVDNPGSSFAAIQEFAVKNGYTLVCHTGNSFYVRNDLVSLLQIPQTILDNPNTLFRS